MRNHASTVRGIPIARQRRADVVAGPGRQRVRAEALEPADEVVVVHDRDLAVAAERVERLAAQPDRRVAVVEAVAALEAVDGAEHALERAVAVEAQREVAAGDARRAPRLGERGVRVARQAAVGVQEQQDVAGRRAARRR